MSALSERQESVDDLEGAADNQRGLSGVAEQNPEIRKHPPETGPKTGLKTASTLSAVEPVSAPPKRKLENRHQRPEPETRPARVEMPEIGTRELGTPA